MISDSWWLIPLALATVFAGTIMIVLVPRPVLLVVLILIRSTADIGTSSAAGPLLPRTIVSGLVAMVAMCAVVLPARGRSSSRLGVGATTVIIALSFWTVVAISNFGLDFSYVGEFIRATSLVALLLLAYRVGIDSGDNLPRWLNLIVGLPAFILIVGFMVGLGSTLNTTGRATGTFGHANQAGAFFAVGVILCIWGYWKTKQQTSIIVAVAALIALLFTQSLGALAALAGGAIVLFSLNAKMSPARRFGLILLGLGVVIALFLSIGASGRLTELEGVDYGDAESDNSLDWRFANWEALVPIWWQRAPLLGLGFGSTIYDVQPLGQAPHSIFVQLLVETGIVGLVLTVFLAKMLVKSIRLRYREHPETAAVLAAICTIVVVHGFAANWLSYGAAQYLALFAVGVLLGQSRIREISANIYGPALQRGRTGSTEAR